MYQIDRQRERSLLCEYTGWLCAMCYMENVRDKGEFWAEGFKLEEIKQGPWIKFSESGARVTAEEYILHDEMCKTSK